MQGSVLPASSKSLEYEKSKVSKAEMMQEQKW